MEDMWILQSEDLDDINKLSGEYWLHVTKRDTNEDLHLFLFQTCGRFC